jgi:iron complex outermembrane receptor protein
LNFADTAASNRETQAVLDFQVGKDVGLGMFGAHGSSRLSAGVRYAQFTFGSRATIKSDQDTKFHFLTLSDGDFLAFWENYNYHQGSIESSRSFRGIGPSISWDASAPLFDASSERQITFDWGASGAILFGRQKVRIHQMTGSAYKKVGLSTDSLAQNISQTQRTGNYDRARMIVVPNVGGFAGLSFRYAAAKVSFGYRADFFFGAMDGGIDTRKSENRGFFGPFATVSVGLGG